MFINVEWFTLRHFNDEVKILLSKAALVVETLFNKGGRNDMRSAEVNPYVKPFGSNVAIAFMCIATCLIKL
jgi:hypothetical protein